MRTGTRRPSTSTRMSDGRPSSDWGPEGRRSAWVGRSASARARSAHVVVWVPFLNSVDSITHRSAGIVVGTPSTRYSSRARTHAPAGSSRSVPLTISLANIES